MAFCTSSVHPVAPQAQPSQAPSTGNNVMASLLGMVMLTVLAGQKSRKQLRKLKRKMTWLLVKEKVRSAFSSGMTASDRKLLIYILLGVALLVLVIYYPILALILAIIALILLLAGKI